MSSPSPSYLILGAGIFGVSTAYHLKKSHPSASVTLIDRDAYTAETRVAASWDWNKVVRADYSDLIYCRLALESQDIFNNDPLWKPYFHETGVYWVCRDDYASDVVGNYKKLGRKADIAAVPLEQAKRLYGGLFMKADYTDAKEVLINKTSGWGAAGDCLRAVTRAAVGMGVEYVQADVGSLIINDDGSCGGVKTVMGEEIRGDKVILATGAYTAKLLELSAAATGKEDLRAGPRIVAGGIATGMVTLDKESYKKFADMPVGFQGYSAEKGPFLGTLPPTPEKQLKWWGRTIFSNTQEVVPGRFVSAPPVSQDYSQWNVSQKLREDVRYSARSFYGDETAKWEFEKLRICWDAFTPTGDFIISPHSGAKGLYVATCGSFHGFKFFPVIGNYVVQMLEGKLEPELQTKWAWDRTAEQLDPTPNPEYPRTEMKDMLDDKPVARL
ncbi:NAD(P)/FAD-dependent oxidoreductase [Aspergillus stella-maris]|uniref:NAD(P)/FAD-dependent oxidoreductase n=1 Tax=Aspergillus stella-maris TaxID=1810926 RepID=UPI003CCCCFD4